MSPIILCINQLIGASSINLSYRLHKIFMNIYYTHDYYESMNYYKYKTIEIFGKYDKIIL